MSTSKTPPRQTYAFAAILCLVPAIVIQVMWMNSGNDTLDITRRKADFLSYFPSYLQNNSFLNLFSVCCCIAAAFLACVGFNQRALPLRLLCIVIVLVAAILALSAGVRLL